jgi:hemerythrin-like domain-containing protein
MGEADSGRSPLVERDIWRIEPLPVGMIASPLDLIFAEHLRHREAAQIMAFISEGEEVGRPDQREIYAMLHGFLTTDLVQHTIDEEKVFFPLLAAICEPQDGIERLIARLSGEHSVDRASEAELTPALAAAAEGGALGPEVRRKLRVFAEHLRQHIALENAVLLPIARARFDAEALSHLEEQLRALRPR